MKNHRTSKCIFAGPSRELGSEAGIFGKIEFFSESGLTNGERVVYLCPIAPDDGDVGGCGAEKILKKMDFGFDKAEKHAIFLPYAPEALRLDEAVLKKF